MRRFERLDGLPLMGRHDTVIFKKMRGVNASAMGGGNGESRMKTRRHHNNKGSRQVRRGRTRGQVQKIAARRGLRYER